MILAIVMGAAGGVISGLLGVGGGIMFVPALTLVLSLSQVKAEATSLLAIIPVAFVGATRQYRYGNVRLRDGAVLGALSAIGVFAGVALANDLSQRALRIGFAVLLVVVATQFLQRYWQARRRQHGCPDLTRSCCCHGQPGAASDWDRVRAAIGSRARTIAIDRPGWNGGAAPADLEGNARAALNALDRAGVDRAVVVGHSFGGAVAAWLGATHAERVRALVLAAPSANAESLRWVDRVLAAPGLGYALGAAALAGSGAALTARPLRSRVARELGLDDRYLRSTRRMLLTQKVWRAFFRGAAGAVPRAALARGAA